MLLLLQVPFKTASDIDDFFNGDPASQFRKRSLEDHVIRILKPLVAQRKPPAKLAGAAMRALLSDGFAYSHNWGHSNM